VRGRPGDPLLPGTTLTPPVPDLLVAVRYRFGTPQQRKGFSEHGGAWRSG
jgi:hypothetical protein